ncbi:MAG: adenylyltransferase/cytidyltransferase family protein [Candidatus Riflebacteria bacterium]|nr:adenylyltransferase/cytidyltransferase family protein [Candidatus Riflebacteria bacterium]
MPLHQDSQAALDAIRSGPPGHRVAFVSGNFNFLHPGHLRLLRFAKDLGDLLVVGVLDAGSPEAYVDARLRLEGIRALSCVDHAFLLHDPPADFVAGLRPAFVVKGKEWEGKENPEAAVLEGYGGRLVFGSGEISFSSVDLLKREMAATSPADIVKPRDFPARHGFDSDTLRRIVDGFPRLRICVIGDIIVDEYLTCDALGMSQEDPTIVVSPIASDRFLGGAGIVAAHAARLGAKVHFFSVTGEDATAAFVRERLGEYAVHPHLFSDVTRPTTLKQRFRAAQKTLLRVSHLRQHSIGADLRAAMGEGVERILPEVDLVIFSDFNYGCLPQELVDRIVAGARARGVLMVADSQASSQFGDVARFKDMALITPTEREARISLHDKESGLVVLAETLRSVARARHAMITLGAEGVLIQSGAAGPGPQATDRLPAFHKAPRDTAGAGDSLLTCTAMSLALGHEIWPSAFLGSLAAACQVGRMGNVPLNPDELRQGIASEGWE